MFWRKVALAGATAFAAVAESDAYPMIEYWQANDYRANPLCDATEGGGLSLTTSAFPYRRSLGLKWLSAKLKQIYLRSARQGASDVIFEANQRRVKNDYDALLQLAVVRAAASRRAGRGDNRAPTSIAAEICETVATTPVSSTPPAWATAVAATRGDVETFCNLMKGVARDVYCQDNYGYEDMQRVYNNQLGGSARPMADAQIPVECIAPINALQDPLDLSVQQYRYTPDTLDWALINVSEKKVFYLLYKSIEQLEKYAEAKWIAAQSRQHDSGRPLSTSIHAIFSNDEVFNNILPEWRVKRLIFTNEVTDSTNLRLPFAVISSRGAANMLLTMRRSLTNFDSRLALYNQQSFKYLYNFTGQLHDGASTYFQSLLSPIVYELTKALNALRESSAKQGKVVAAPLLKLTVTAADMPGVGAAAALGNHISRHFGKSIQVDVVLFGSPYFADKEMMENLRNNVELRVIQLEGDSTDLAACPQVLSCDHNDLIIRTGIDSGVVYEYQRAHGYIKVPLAELGRSDAAWTADSAFVQLAAIRDCGYNCVLANAACGNAQSNTDMELCHPEACAAFV